MDSGAQAEEASSWKWSNIIENLGVTASAFPSSPAGLVQELEVIGNGKVRAEGKVLCGFC